MQKYLFKNSKEKGKHQKRSYLISANSSSPESSIICCCFFSRDMTVGDSSEFKNFSAGSFTVSIISSFYNLVCR